MCGFLAAFGSKEGIKKILPKFKESSCLLTHRGPDFEKLKLGSNFLLFHARLSIVDLSSRSNQPFESNDKRFSLIYNGEIYNYLSIKDQLNSKYNFKTNSDTEVVLASYLEWGTNCLNKLNGMFSFAIWDNVKNELFFTRDHFGQKPLYYHHSENMMYISSEIKPLLHLTQKKTLDLFSVQNYLTNNSYASNKKTFFKYIDQIPPGTYGVWSSQNLNIYKYFGKENFDNYALSKHDNKTMISILQKTIDEHLMGRCKFGPCYFKWPRFTCFIRAY